MKRTVLIITLCFYSLMGMWAQQPQNRTVSTVIADALAQLPANTQAKYNQTIEGLMSTGEDGLLRLVEMMDPSGTKSNEAVAFALCGWTHMAATNESQRQITAKAYIKALESSTNSGVKAFIIRQLGLIGKEESIAPLSSYYLYDETLSDPAAQALGAINDPKAHEALLMALKSTNTEKIKISLVNTLGQINYAPAATYLMNLLWNEPSPNLQSALLTAIGQLGSKKELKPLQKEAEKANYEYNKTGATKAYTALIHRVAQLGDTKTAKKEARQLLSKATDLDKQELRINALEILMSLPGADKTKLLTQALTDSHLDYVSKALAYSSNEGQKKITDFILSNASTTNPVAQTAILYWIGNQKVEAGTPAVLNGLTSKRKPVQKAAISTSEKLTNPAILEGLSQLLNSKDEEIIALTKQALSSHKAPIATALEQAFPNASDAGKVAILDLLALRRSTGQYELVLSQLKANRSEIKMAALKALPSVVSDNNLTELFGLLEGSSTDPRTAIQKAILSALSAQTPEEQYKVILNKMEKTGSKKLLYYNLLANTGTQLALNRLVSDYTNTSGQEKAAVFEALTQWRNFEVIYPLLNIARTSQLEKEVEQAVDAITHLIDRSKQTGEVKTIFLREAMKLATTDQQKNNILKLTGNTGTFQGLLFLEQYLDNASLQENAAQATMKIALNHKEYAGAKATQLLKKVSEVLNNPDAQYQRQAIQNYLDENPTEGGFTSMFNGKDLEGWQGLVSNPISRAKMSQKELAREQARANKKMTDNWSVKDGAIVFNGAGANLCSTKDYGDFELVADWRITKEGDSGIYLRGAPQVQVWDTSRVEVGAQVGSGGLYNNQKHASKPLKVADNQVGEWNTFHITMIGEKVTVYLNGELVVDNVTMENYWDRSQPIFPTGAIELQAHGTDLAFRDIYVREITPEKSSLTKEEEQEGFAVLFDGSNMDEWTGNKTEYIIEEGNIVIHPSKNFGGNLYTQKEYDNFIFRFEFQLTPGANNGLGIRTPLKGDAAYVGMELQILDNTAPIYANLHEYQYHGSVYGVIASKRGYQKPVGEWNTQEVIANGDQIKITLNGTVIVDGNIREAATNGTRDGKDHPGLFNTKGHIGFLGHGSVVKFRNIRIKEL